jgi:steroid 5-alpha reductase family enzyme
MALGALAARGFEAEAFFMDVTLPVHYLMGLALFEGVIDIRLTKLREAGERWYRIPTGFPFNYVLCPNYLCEVLIWLIWGLMLRVDIGVIAIWLWMLPNLCGRAELTHKWYQSVFKGQYPKGRTALIPGVNTPRLLGALIRSV